ncbi:MAG: hypothetical protein OHK0039_17210 [Bacteroidia bacterium]
MYLFFDTETTGLPRDWKAPVTALDNWPRLVQLAWLAYDETGKLLDTGEHIVRPEGFRISSEVARIHGITHDRALAEGEPVADVLRGFGDWMRRASYLVAHNMAYDEKIIGAEFLRLGLPNLLDAKPKICTMQRSAAFCNIPGPYGPKWPKLAELHQKLFHTTFAEAHDAAVDIQITAKCFWALRQQNIL